MKLEGKVLGVVLGRGMMKQTLNLVRQYPGVANVEKVRDTWSKFSSGANRAILFDF